MSTWREKQIGLLLIVGSMVWAVYHVMHEQVSLAYLRLGPMQLFMAGLMIWLHGKYRRAVEVNRA
jgi:hypothetical protein